MVTKAHAEVYNALNEQSVFSHMSNKTIEALSTCAVLKNYRANQFLWKFGDRGDHCTLITSGLIEINRPTGEEEDTCMGIFTCNDIVGLSALLHKVNFPGSAKALTETSTIKLYLDSLNNIPDNNEILKEVADWVREKILTHEHILREKIDIVTAGSIENRLRELFRHLLRRFGSIHSGCKYEISIQLPKTKAARIMGMRSETAIRLINEWQKLNLISWGEDRIIIHDLNMIDRFIAKQVSK